MALLDNTSQQQYYNDENFGNYQFTSLNNIINQFMIGFVGEDKVISKISRSDVSFHAQRALQELSFDTFKSCKSIEYDVPAGLSMPLPIDYVNYTAVSWIDDSGIKHRIYPTSKTSNPTRYQQDSNGDYLFNNTGGLIESGNLISNSSLQGGFGNFNLNVDVTDNTGQTSTAAAGTTADPISNSVGWFFDDNSIIGYNLAQNQGFNVLNLPIESGEKYTITYTLSGYTSGTYEWVVVDENQDFVVSAQVSADGTHTATIDLSTGLTQTNTYPALSIGFRQVSATAGNVRIDDIKLTRDGDEDESKTLANFSSSSPSENTNYDYEDNVYWPGEGERYGLDPQHAQVNGSFYIDCKGGKIHFSSNISGQTIVLDYISDSLGTDSEMQVHKLAEEAMYKCIAYSVISNRANMPEYIVRRFKKEKFAETRKAKLRLSNIKLEEITQILRGKSKQIKH